MDHDICVQEEKKISLSKTEEEEEPPIGRSKSAHDLKKKEIGFSFTVALCSTDPYFIAVGFSLKRKHRQLDENQIGISDVFRAAIACLPIISHD